MEDVPVALELVGEVEVTVVEVTVEYYLEVQLQKIRIKGEQDHLPYLVVVHVDVLVLVDPC